jgi:ABC-type Zn uptake system ZnuABC Zn-binding protein ZnuA
VKVSLLLAIACSLCVASATSALGTNIVCTTTIIGDIVSQIAGDAFNVQVLFSPDMDPHAFEPRPQDLVALQRADLIFINGLDLEAGLADILEPLGDTVVSLSQDLPNLLAEEPNGGHADHGVIDPHVWFDPTLVATWVDVIAGHLSERAPLQAADIRARAIAYQSQLAELDRWIVTTLEQIPPEHRRLVTDHHVFGYFEAQYGLKQVGAIFPGLSTLSEPSARDIADLVSTIESLDIPAIFVGTTINSSLAQQIAADTGTRVIPLYTGALSDSAGPAATYLDFMRYTVTVLVEGLTRLP